MTSSLRSLLGGAPTSFILYTELLTYHNNNEERIKDNLRFGIQWTDLENMNHVKSRIRNELDNFISENVSEYCEIDFIKHKRTTTTNNNNTSSSSSYSYDDVDIELKINVKYTYPKINSIEFKRINGNYNVNETLLKNILETIDLSSIKKIKCSEGYPLFVPEFINAQYWNNIQYINLSYCNISNLPSSIGNFTLLEELRLSNNKLSTLPQEIEKLKYLKILIVDHNQLITIPSLIFINELI